MDPSSPVAAAATRDHHEQTPKTSLRHILASEPDMEEEKPTPSRRNSPGAEGSAAAQDETTKDEPETQPSYRATTTTTRRNANGTVSSVYAGNKIRHLKKDDGIPLWRKDIQYDFLRYVFEDDKRVFHKVTDGPGGELHTFADIYLDAMANSSKCSKILKDKLLSERPAAVNMAMVCLLVNVGRMNTTLNFFPEMRAQLRTYHSIPSLQAHQDPNAYKQLQDAPRLKSILKGASEDVEQPNTIEDIKKAQIPRTNPVNLIFVLSQYAPKISEMHFFPPRDFFDLVMRPSLSSRSRATAFLWLMWWYLESSFTKEDALNNPFGAGQYADPSEVDSGAIPIKCPIFEVLSPEQEALENVDTPDEKNFGEIKRKERIAILQSDMAPVVTGPKRSGKRGERPLSGEVHRSGQQPLTEAMARKWPAGNPFTDAVIREKFGVEAGSAGDQSFTQNPVFSVLADDGASTPGKDRQSPSHGSARGRGKLAKSIIERDYPSDTDRTRSASPPGSVLGTAKKGTPNMRINTLINDEAPALTPAPKGPGRGNWSRKPGGSARGFKAKLEVQGTSQEGQSPLTTTVPPVSTYTGPHGFYLPLNGSDPSHKRTRPLTAHQLAVEQFRRRRVDVILDRGLRAEYERARKRRRAESSFLRSWVRCKGMTDGYDTDEESNIQALQQADIEHGSKQPPPMFAGLLPLNYGGEVNDYGEEAYWRGKMVKRVVRRLERWEEGRGVVRVKGGKSGGLRAPADSVGPANGVGASATPAAKRNGLERKVEEDEEDGERLQQSRRRGGERGGEDEDDEDEEMQDVGERGEMDEEEDEDEEMYDGHTLPPLSSVV